MKVKWRNAANLELLGLVGYLFPKNAPAARRLFRRTKSRVRQLVDFPFSGRVGRVPGTREIVVLGTPYLVVYTVDNDTAIILSVIHTSQLWPPSAD